MGKFYYNELLLPDIESVYTPKVQKTHPYAWVYEGSLINKAVLCFSDLPWVCSGNTCYTDGEIIQSHLYRGRDTWGELEPTKNLNHILVCPDWSNHDVLYKDSTDVYLYKSDPIPATPKAALMGYLTGEKL